MIFNEDMVGGQEMVTTDDDKDQLTNDEVSRDMTGEADGMNL